MSQEPGVPRGENSSHQGARTQEAVISGLGHTSFLGHEDEQRVVWSKPGIVLVGASSHGKEPSGVGGELGGSCTEQDWNVASLVGTSQ